MNVRLTGVLLLLAIPHAWGSSAGAPAGPSAGGSAATPWMNTQEYEICGQACSYKKANEMITMKALYIINKVTALSRANQEGDEEAVKANLTGFCLTSDTAESCFKRYKNLQITALYKMRAAIAHNNESESKHTGNQAVMAANLNGPDPKKGQSTYVVTFEDLQKEYAQLRQFGAVDLRSESGSPAFRPSKDEFLLFDKIPRNPGHLEEGLLTVVKRDASGNPMYDLVAYSAAMKSYNDRMGGERGEFDELRKMDRAKIARQQSGRDLKQDTATLSRESFNQTVSSFKGSIAAGRAEVGPKLDFSKGAKGRAGQRAPTSSSRAGRSGRSGGEGSSAENGDRTAITLNVDLGGGDPKMGGDPTKFNFLSAIQDLEKLP